MAGRQLRVLHVVGAMDRGGAETWLMYVLRNIDRERFHFDFLAHTKKVGAYDEEIKTLGSRVLVCPNPQNLYTYTPNLCKILHDYGPYDVVHSHVHHFSGIILTIACIMHVPIRISHSHNDTLNLEAKANFQRRLYLKLMKQLISRYATVGLAASKKAAIALWGERWSQNPKWRILYCSIDLGIFSNISNNQYDLRNKIGLAKNTIVLGHIGRFSTQKNHAFLLKIAQATIKQHKDTMLLLIGDGPLRQIIEQQACDLGIREHVIFAGTRNDIPQLLQAIDVFVFPSLYEGLPVAALEAQAAGIPIILSDTITNEVAVIQELFHWYSLKQPPEAWAQACLQLANYRMSPLEAYTRLATSPFNVNYGIQRLQEVYEVNDYARV